MITFQDIVVVGFLAFLEAILSIDNAVVLAVMVKHLPPKQQKMALTYGLAGAVVFRLIALSIATYLIQMRWVKFVGGGYLIFIGLKHLLQKQPHGDETKPVRHAGFWKTVVMIEIMDIAFAVDSILAAVAISPKLWIVFFGGFIGVLMIRYAATFFAKLLLNFPTFEVSAYLLVLVIGLKLTMEGFHFPGVDFMSASNPAFWIFWMAMALCVAFGFRRTKKSPS
ncbi:MAG TPA: hypothetical protein DCS07_04315 [Bdellovibrionales bacterium]|nr:MAG: hypothetical protein A2Z97_04320 [Bdellovibrionales bacterium GWB1_52_6]OFZ05060.1 MAG: hypothetical protein A2X97_00510 [Bdellovibrionales bacterium GWA1_52_35]HAR41843.1 hypothetical protein [Bdellovibrionales bacterium]HCM41296.1 hypothetical protein [Bdellovibrionales bacterium]